MKYVNSLITDQNITMVFDDAVKICPRNNPNYDLVKTLIFKGQPTKALEAFDITLKLKRHSSGEFFVGEDGIVYMDKNNPVPMPMALSKRVIQFAEANLDFKPLVNFWNNIQLNPNPESIKDLYGFLEHNGIPITQDGCFCAYKKVQADYKSGNAGVWEFDEAKGEWVKNEQKFYDNTPGQVVTMPREKVDANREVTCSSGLHVAAFNYAIGYSGTRMVLVKVNPINVVSVPTDYNLEKMRTCGYEVLQDITEELKTPTYGPVDEAYWDDEEDEEEWDDATANDWDNDEEDEDIDAEEGSDEETDQTYYLSPDKSGRVCIPNALVKAIGLTPGQIAYVETHYNSIVISPSYNNSNYKYVVDRDSNIRLSKSCVDASEIVNTYSNLQAHLDEDANVIRIN